MKVTKQQAELVLIAADRRARDLLGEASKYAGLGFRDTERETFEDHYKPLRDAINAMAPSEGTELIVHHWSREHGDCYDCGDPAAFIDVDGLDSPEYVREMLPSGQFEHRKLCAVCAANRAAEGEKIARIVPEDWEV